MAYYLEKTGNTKAAEQYYRKAIAVEPHSGSAMNNYGTFLCRTGQYQAAIAAFLSAAREKEYLYVAGAYENAGTCALMMHNNALALQFFHQAINNNPNMPFALLSMARINHVMGNNANAVKYFMVFGKVFLAGKSARVAKKYHDYVFSGKTGHALPIPQ
jgi:type IV pilus assembly protein PilF